MALVRGVLAAAVSVVRGSPLRRKGRQDPRMEALRAWTLLSVVVTVDDDDDDGGDECVMNCL